MRIKSSWILCVAVCLLGGVSQVQALVNKTFCVYDPIGGNGPVFQQMKDYQAAALEWGVKFTVKPYTDERVAAEDFKSGACDAVGLTGARGRQFNPFTGTLDSVGAMPTYAHVKTVMKILSEPKAAALMKRGEYEVAMLAPGGAVYLYLKDRNLKTVNDLSGKRFAVFEADSSQRELVLKLGASPVSASIAGMYSQFNNGSVDVCVGPAVVYQAMELYKGLEPKGGVVKFAVGQLSLQVLIRQKDFPAGFGEKSRAYGFSRYDTIMQVVTKADKTIADRWWIAVSDEHQRGYREMFRKARIELRNKGIYDAKMLTLLRKVRCNLEPTGSECTAPDRE